MFTVKPSLSAIHHVFIVADSVTVHRDSGYAGSYLLIRSQPCSYEVQTARLRDQSSDKTQER
jgi:hypothetical protein